MAHNGLRRQSDRTEIVFGRTSDRTFGSSVFPMETQSLNCSVFFNPINVNTNENGHAECLKHEHKRRLKFNGSSGGELFTITYMPQEVKNSQPEAASVPPKHESIHKREASTCKSCVEIEEFISPTSKSQGHLKMNYVLDGELKCHTCWELKQALDFTIQKLHNVAQRKKKAEKKEDAALNACSRDMRKRCKYRKHCRNPQSNVGETLTKTFINEEEDVGPLAEFFSRLIRSATIRKMKTFSRDVEKKLSYQEMTISRCNNSWEDLHICYSREIIKGKIMKKDPPKEDNTCKACDRLQKSMYNTVSKLYEAAGVKTDFPIIHKLETYAFLVYPNGVQYTSASKQPNESKFKRSSAFNAKSEESQRDMAIQSQRQRGRRRSENRNPEDHRTLLRRRIKRHKAAFTASKFVHILTALAVSLTTIALISLDWMITKVPYSPRVFGVLVVLLIGCLYNLYLIFVLGIYSFKNYFIIPVCWVALSLSNGKCADPLLPDYVCDTKIHFMSQVYLFAVLLEYYLASGIHAVLVLEINQFRRIPRSDLLKYSLFNLPLLIIVVLYFIFLFIYKTYKCTKDYIMKMGHIVDLQEM